MICNRDFKCNFWTFIVVDIDEQMHEKISCTYILLQKLLMQISFGDEVIFNKQTLLTSKLFERIN